MRLKPFRAWRPRPELAARVASPPYDVVSREEATKLAEGNPLSFLHVGRSDIDLPPEVDPYDPAVYATARANLDRLMQDGVLQQDQQPVLFLYQLTMQGRSQVGVVGCVHIDDYAADIIRKHEKTRRDKEDDRTRHVLTLDANAEPVFLTFRDEARLAGLIAEGTRGPALYDFTAADGIRHQVWRIADPVPWVDAFTAVPVAYVADGHHRCASAWRAGQELRSTAVGEDGAEYEWFLATLFPASQLRILPYHRVVRDLNRLSPEQFLARLGEVGRVEQAPQADPAAPGTIGFFLAGRWYHLTLPPNSIDRSDPIRSLDAALLEERVLGPILDIGDIRTDKRIDFVGGIRGTAELERRVNSGEMALAVALYPVTVEQLMAVSDAGAIMPPKTTWFEPKLRSGLFVHTLDSPIPSHQSLTPVRGNV
ncbi:MAG TPA: DUF1015 family protein [Gemmatimonadales bacterium]|nr:DUF1015 family protein [Gemmatimonadales bacterium]